MDSCLTTLVLADDHHLVRQGLMLLMKNEPDFRVVGEAGDGLGALQLVAKTHPDILLLDLAIPRVHGLEVTRQVRQNHSSTRVIILSMHKEESYVIEALRNGAAGYILKDSTGTDLIEGVRKVKAGRRYLSPSLEEIAIALLEHRPSSGEADAYESLSNRERIVLQLAAEGLSSHEIADRLFISRRTAETHRANLMRKLDLRSQTDLVRFAIRRGVMQA
jgi:DNA-binding NarL/FixJ family response regulator